MLLFTVLAVSDSCGHLIDFSFYAPFETSFYKTNIMPSWSVSCSMVGVLTNHIIQSAWSFGMA